jgi:DNA repair protein RadC
MDLDSPITRVLIQGWSGAAFPDLMAIGLCRNEDDLADAEVRGRELARSLGGLHAITDLSRDRLQEFSGLNDLEMFRCLAWLELGRRTKNAGKGERDSVMAAADVAYVLRHLQNEKQEHFVIVLLDAKNTLIKWTTIHIGTLTTSLVGPREVFREAIREGACSMILAHNHPSGDPDPSPEDISITKKLEELGKLLDIQIWDHVIIGFNRFASLRELGFLNPIG